MNYEEKYKQALEKLKQGLSSKDGRKINGITRNFLEGVFPELKDSEDEKTRKEMLDFFNQLEDKKLRGVDISSWISWLEKQGEHANFRNKIQTGDKVTRNEAGVLVNLSQLNRVAKPSKKQGEQKPIDRVKPKFKVGDWIINNDKRIAFPTQILKIEEYGYVTSIGYTSFDKVKTDYHLWTIQDAKDGDVLADGFSIFTFKERYTAEKQVAHGGLIGNRFVKSSGGWWTNQKCYPATEEQHELLFQKMKEAGYEWDAEKTELKKIEQKPACSEEDEKNYQMLQKIICDSNITANLANKLSGWLKSLKDRFQPQPKQEWSEEDEKILSSIIEEVYPYGECPDYPTEEEREYYYTHQNMVDWLKSLKPNLWKPSEEQLKALHWVAEYGNITQSELLKSLYNDLKKL